MGASWAGLLPDPPKQRLGDGMADEADDGDEPEEPERPNRASLPAPPEHRAGGERQRQREAERK